MERVLCGGAYGRLRCLLIRTHKVYCLGEAIKPCRGLSKARLTVKLNYRAHVVEQNGKCTIREERDRERK